LDLTVMKHKADALDAKTDIHINHKDRSATEEKDPSNASSTSRVVHTLSLTSTQLFMPAAAAECRQVLW